MNAIWTSKAYPLTIARTSHAALPVLAAGLLLTSLSACGSEESLNEQALSEVALSDVDLNEVDLNDEAQVEGLQTEKSVELGRGKKPTSLIFNPCQTQPKGCEPIGQPIDEGSYPPDTEKGLANYTTTHQQASGGTIKTTALVMDANGQLLTPEGVVLSQVTTSTSAVAGRTGIAFNGSIMLAVWSEPQGTTYSVMARRMSESGQLLDTAPILLAAGVGAQATPAVASTNGSFLVAWSDERTGEANLMGTIVDGRGTVRTPRGIVISSQTGAEQLPAIESNGSQYTVVFALNGNILARSVNASGQLVDVAQTIVSAPDTQTFPAISYGKDSFLVAYEDHNERGPGIGAVLLSHNGTLLGALEPLSRDQFAIQPDISFAEGTYMVAWNTVASTGAGAINGVLLDAGGSQIDYGTLAVDAVIGMGPALAPSGKDHRAVWAGKGSGGFYFYSEVF